MHPAAAYSIIALVFLTLIGWGINIVEIFHLETILSGEGALRIVGIFIVPIGAIMGWFV